jgi:organic hydroperoxide reductase OsmC/OhrA
MKPFPHDYDAQLSGAASGYAMMTSAGLPDLRTAPPLEFDGPGDAWTPEHLLLASVQTCFLFTFRAVARASKLDFDVLNVTARGVVDRQEGVTRFSEIALNATLFAGPGLDRERAIKALQKSERNCLVTASLSTPVRLEIKFG